MRQIFFILFSFLLLDVLAVDSFASPLADLKVAAARVQLHRAEPGSYKLVVLPLTKPGAVPKSGKPGKEEAEGVKVFQASKPSRLVVDYYGLAGRGSKNVSLNDKMLKAIRIGDNVDRTRVVVDVRGDSVITFSAPLRLGTGDAYRVDFFVTSPKAVREAAAKPTATPVLSGVASPTPRLAAGVTLTPNPANVVRPTPEATLPPLPVPAETVPLIVVTPTPVRTPADTQLTVPIETPVPVSTPESSPVPLVSAFPLPLETPVAEDAIPPASTPLPEGIRPEGTPVSTPTIDAPLEIPDRPLPTATPEETIRPSATETPRSEPLELPTLNTGSAGRPVFSDIGFERLKDSRASAVSFVVDGLKNYSLQKRRDDLYELNIDGGILSQPGLTLPRFAPEGIQGFELVVARQEQGYVAVRIFVNEGVRLFPFVADGKLWVKALSGGASALP